MRVTNKIIQNNTLYNINNSKVLQDKLETQISTKKTVTRPSDDPVVAIRSLRLRTNLNQVTQYYKKNIPDAQNWLDLTESAINNTTDILTEMIDLFQKGSKGSLTTSDRAIMIDGLKQYRNEVYSTGDADYAGRTLFTGYRTDYKLTFQNDVEKNYQITEQLTNLDIKSFSHVNIGNVKNINEANYNAGTTTPATEIKSMDVIRMQLSYKDLDAGFVPTLTQTVGYDTDGNPITQPLGTPVVLSKDGSPDPYRMVADKEYADYDENAIVFVPETGELLFGTKAAENLKALDSSTPINITYEKTNWLKGDLMPEHYFACSSEGIDYNEVYLTKNGSKEKQVISYDVGFNQTLEVNTTADEVFDHGIGRCVDEMIALLEKMSSIDQVVTKLKSMKGDSRYDEAEVSAQLEIAEKAQTFMEDNLQKRFENGITSMRGYLDKVNLALTNNGNRGSRLELVENRLSNQQASFTELTSKNDDADLAELAVELGSAQLTYNAALAATGKILQTSLLNYI